MYMKMRGIIYIVILILLSSCGNFLDEYSQDLVVPKTVSDLNEVLLGNGYIPSSEIEYLRNGSTGWQLNILDDDINTVIAYNAVKNRTEMDGVYYGYTTWQMEVGRNHTGDNLSGDNGNWDALYQRINSMNIILHELGNVSQNTEQEVKDAIRVQGECYFLRAQFYLMLVNLYAKAYDPDNAATEPGVPLKLTYYVEHDKEKETQFDRTSVAKVYEQIVKDLKEAVRCFTESPQTKSFYRASEDAALLLLSRVYLYMQDWENAKSTAEKLLAQNGALLDYSSIAENTDGYAISEKSPELLFSQGPLNLQCEFSGSGGDFCVSNDLYKLYDENDYRQTIYFTRSTQSDSLGLNRKYQMGKHRSYVSDIFTLRTAEGYLNAAEACAMLGDAGAASGWLNRLRGKRIKDYEDVVYTADEIIEQVRVERRKELCLEGHRWLDLRRYAVCKKSPFKKIIERVYALYDWDGRSVFKYAEVYQLNVDDPAYVFAIPKAVLEFDKDMPDNIREDREYVRLMYRNNE